MEAEPTIEEAPRIASDDARQNLESFRRRRHVTFELDLFTSSFLLDQLVV